MKTSLNLAVLLLVLYLLVACEGFAPPSGPQRLPPNRTEDSVDVSTCRFYNQEPGSAARLYRCADPEGVYDSVFYITRDTL